MCPRFFPPKFPFHFPLRINEYIQAGLQYILKSYYVIIHAREVQLHYYTALNLGTWCNKVMANLSVLHTTFITQSECDPDYLLPSSPITWCDCYPDRLISRTYVLPTLPLNPKRPVFSTPNLLYAPAPVQSLPAAKISLRYEYNWNLGEFLKLPGQNWPFHHKWVKTLVKIKFHLSLITRERDYSKRSNSSNSEFLLF